MQLARATLESLLRERQLDRTLTSALPIGTQGSLPGDEYATAPTTITALDARLGGGFPRGHISEIVGARSSGCTSVMLQTLAAATARDEIVALVDVLDMLDVPSAEAAGIDFRRLLWIRGEVTTSPGFCRDRNARAIDRAIKAITLVLQAGNFGLVVFDAAEAPPQTLQRLPFTTWRRLHRIIEGSQTACVLVVDVPVARSPGGVTVKLNRAGAARGERLRRAEDKKIRGEPGSTNRSGGIRVHGQLFEGLDVELEVIRARATVRENVCMCISTACR